MSHPATIVMDVGTHAARSVLFDGRGRPLASAMRDVTLARPAAGRAEQDGAGILGALRESMSELLGESQVSRAGLAVQRSSIIAWDSTNGEPLSPVLSWQDTRAADRLKPLSEHETEIARRTGLRLSPHYGASKMAWCLDQMPNLAQPLAEGRLIIGPLAGFLIANICEGLPSLVDHANASRTLLWNLRQRDWDPWLLSLFDLPPDILPSSRPILHPYGSLREYGVPLLAVSGDQNAALFASGEMEHGEVRVNLGTGAFVLAGTGQRPLPSDTLLSGLAISDAESAGYLLEGTVNGAGAALSWARRQWALCDLDEAFAEGGQEVPIFLNAVGGIGSPFWRHDAIPRFAEADPERLSAAQITRAVAESILFLVCANVDAMKKAGVPVRSLTASGGLSRSDELCQALADLAGLPLRRAVDTEATARGMAWLIARERADWATSESRLFTPEPKPALAERYRRALAEFAR